MPDTLNPYQPPQTELLTEGAPKEGVVWFTVSTPKLWTMSVLTLGLYRWYWFYKNWCVVRDQRGESVSPFWRSTFFVLFAYALFQRVSLDAVDRDQPMSWTSGGMAGIVFGAAAADNVLNRLPISDTVPLLGIAFVLLPVLAGTAALASVQRTTNALNGDPQGSSNAGYTPGALVFGLLGLALWGLVFLGAFLS